MNLINLSLLLVLCSIASGFSSGTSSDISSGASVFWLHIEGAPTRMLFDQWPTPLTKKTGTHPLNYRGETLFLPEVLFTKGRPTQLLSHWHLVRSIQTQNTHAEEVRREWLALFKNEKFSVDVSTQNTELDLIYKSALSSAKGPVNMREPELRVQETFHRKWQQKSSSPPPPGLVKVFSSWLAPSSSAIRLGVLSADQDKKSFPYKDLITSLEILTNTLKERKQFSRSVILITSDQNRILLDDGSTRLTPEGIPLTLISASLNGPNIFGNIRRAHPDPNKEKELPGTWGLGLKQWYPANVHDLIIDLKRPEQYIQLGKRKASKNPWYHISPFQALSPKLKWGQIF